MKEILVVDDSRLNQTALYNMLHKDYDVVCVSSGREMFEKLEETDPMLILLDVIMPELDGFQVIQKLKASEEYHKIPVIFITGLASEASEELGFKLGAIDYITKPFNENVVKARVNSYVQLHEFIRQAEFLGQNDGLTGLYNKKTTEETIKKQLASTPSLESGALMIIDVDNFKSINDTFGHQRGDTVIVELASTLRGIFQKSDILGRVGGDEFFVFLRNYNSKPIIVERAKEVCRQFEKTYEMDGQSVKISASVGISTMEDSTEFEDMYEFADIALYDTKARGKNNFTFYVGQSKTGYKSTRTEIETTSNSNTVPQQFIRHFSEQIKDYANDLTAETKMAVANIHALLNLINTKHKFEISYIVKFVYGDDGIRCVYNWNHSNSDYKPEIASVSQEDLEELYDCFEHNTYIVTKPGDKFYDFAPDYNADNVAMCYALKNKKTLLGYILFERQPENKLTPKTITDVLDNCWQLSGIVINQFLIENSVHDKEQLATVLDSFPDPIFVYSSGSAIPYYKNKAAQSDAFENNNPLTEELIDKLIAGATNNESLLHEDDNYSCKQIDWSYATKAYVIRVKNF